MSLFSYKKKVESQAVPGLGSWDFRASAIGPEHRAILTTIKSPWAVAIHHRGSPEQKKAALRGALKTCTVDQVAEYAFVVSRPAAEAKAVLARGRSQFTETALRFTLKSLTLSTLQQLVANEGALLIAIIEDGVSGLTSKR